MQHIDKEILKHYIIILHRRKTNFMNESISSIENHICRLCDESTLRPFLDLGTMPIANAFLSSEQLSEPEYTFNFVITILYQVNV